MALSDSSNAALLHVIDKSLHIHLDIVCLSLRRPLKKGCVEVRTEQTCRRRQKVVVLMELTLHRAIIYTTKMSKQVTKIHVRDAVHMYPVN
jgi:hypothetical protein